MLKPKRVTEYRKIWLHLKHTGYDVIPLLSGKDKPFTGWPNQPNDPASILTWNGRAAAVRMYGSRLFVIDVDVINKTVCDAIVAMLRKRWPDFMTKCLQRHSSRVKIAFIGRTNTTRKFASTWRYTDPAEPPDTEGKRTSQRVEIFTGRDKRYLGVHGMHSTGRDYGYHGPSILDVAEVDLPEFPAADIEQITAACEEIMDAAGFTRHVPTYGKTDKPVVYDITAATRFDVNDGPDQVDYDELVALHAVRTDLRVSGSFIDGSGDRTKCHVRECYLARGAVCVFDYEDRAWHCPIELDPTKATEGLADDLKAAAALHGVEPPVPVPDWREVYEGTTFPKASLENVRRALLINGIVCALDTFHNVMTIGAAQPRADMRFLGIATDARIMSLRGWLSAHYGKDFTEKHVYDAVVLLAGENKFDPVADMLAAAEAAWDGVKRLDRMAADYFMAEDTVLNSTFVRKTMIGAVARVRSPGCKFDTILTMESPEGWNKSSSWAVLAGEGNFSDVKIIGATEKEVMEQLAGVWIHENAELAGMRKTEIEMVKAFASRQVDIARPAYGRITLRQPRHSIEVGTTNANAYLLSTDGNRRFWPIKVLAPIDLDKLKRDRLQLWGEAAAAQSAGEDIVLPEELRSVAAEAQEARRLEHPIEAVLAALTVRTAEGPIGTPEDMKLRIITQFEGEERVSSKDILYTALGLNIAYSNMGHSNTVAAVMRKLGWTKKLYKAGGIPVKGYVRPARVKLTVVS